MSRLDVRAAAVLSILPHGRLSVLQATAGAKEIARTYNRDLFATDDLSWQALRSNAPAHGLATSPSADRDTLSFNQLLHTLNIGRSVALPLKSPLLAGYPGVLHLYRSDQDPPFTPQELQIAQKWANDHAAAPADAQQRVIVLDAELTPSLNGGAWTLLDAQLRETISQFAKDRLAEVSQAQPVLSDRRTQMDSRSLLHSIRYVASRSHPAHSGSGVVLIAMQPEIDEWLRLRPENLAAHTELLRFLPALLFMRKRAAENVTLQDIARSVNLSPFHFHRRFVDLVGMTPKQFLLDCQITDAQAMLIEGKLQLSVIARQCGFSHQSHFTSRFKQATGVTPTRWKKVAINSLN